MITKETLIFYGLSEDIANMVLENKLLDSMREQIKDLHNYNVVFLYGKKGIDKDFIIGKIVQLYLQNEHKVLITDLPNLDYMFDNDIPTPDYARIIIIRNLEIATQKHLSLLKMLPYVYKKKTLIVDVEEKDAMVKNLLESFLWSIKVKQLEV